MTLDLDAIEARANAATEGPWQWVDNAFGDDPNEAHIDHGWTDQGPNLVHPKEWYRCRHSCMWADGSNTHRGEKKTPGHEHLATEAVISSWGHDAWGIDVRRADGEFIAHARTDIPALVAEVRRLQKMLAGVP